MFVGRTFAIQSAEVGNVLPVLSKARAAQSENAASVPFRTSIMFGEPIN